MKQRQINILKVYHQASAAELQSGMRWYQQAHEDATAIANTLPIGAGAIAALSPGLRWESNVEAARRVIAGESLDGLGVRWYDGVRKAKRIAKGHNPLVVLKGNKVRAFYSCILSPDASQSVCVDGHAYSVWAGKRILLADTPPLNDKLYNCIASEYVECARALCIKPHQLQAITWVAYRRLNEI